MMSKLLVSFLVAVTASLAACGGPKAVGTASIYACAKQTENKLVDQATQALISAASKDPTSVGGFLDSLALDAASAGVTDAIGFTTCVAEAVKAKLLALGAQGDLDQHAFATVMSGLSQWEAEHPRLAK